MGLGRPYSRPMVLLAHDCVRLMANLHQTLLNLSAANKLDVATFMHHALYHPLEGYYAKPYIWGQKGDYITAPDMTQVFGEMIALWLMQEWQNAGSPPNIHLVELGPGRGTLLKDMLTTFRIMPTFGQALQAIHLLDVRPAFEELHTRDSRIRTYQRIQDIPNHKDAVCWIISNEFFDSLPIQQYLPDGLTQHIDATESGGWAFRHPTERTREICNDAPMWIQEFKRLLGTQGRMLAIDYGHTSSEYEQSTLQALYQHRYVHCLTHVGQADLTCHVNWNHWLSAAGGASALIPQGQWLLSMGAEERTAQLAHKATPEEQTHLWTALARLTDPNHMGKLFQTWIWKPETFK